MKKEGVIAVLFVILITVGVFAETIPSDLSEEVSDYVKSFVKQEGIQEQQINEITPVDPNNLPPEVEINQIEKNNIGIYEVNFTDNNESKKVFIVTYSTNNLEQTPKYIVKNLQTWVFGYPAESSSSDYLYTAAGVKSSETIGYVMIRPGSITGLSTSLEITSGSGNLNIKVYKNGQDTGFNNVISPSDIKKIDYDIQSENITSYQAGDILSVYIDNTGDVNWKNAVVSVETTS